MEINLYVDVSSGKVEIYDEDTFMETGSIVIPKDMEYEKVRVMVRSHNADILDGDEVDNLVAIMEGRRDE